MFDNPNDANVTVGLGNEGMRLAKMNEGITPFFFEEPVKNETKTSEAGYPVYDSLPRVRLFVAGDPYNQVTHPLDDAQKERFPIEYKAWVEKKTAMHISGTPLRQWPLLGPAEIASFEEMKIFSVQALAQIPDSSLQRAYGLREWRDKAKAWLDSAGDHNAAVRYAEENRALRDDIAALKDQMAELVAASQKPKHKAA